MKNKKILLIAVGVLIILVILGLALYSLNNKPQGENNNEDSLVEKLVQLSAEDVGLVLSTQKNNQQLVMELNNLENVESFDYEVSYDAIENGEVIKQGTFGSGPNPTEKGKTEIKRVIDLGTCSAVCRYHKGIEEIQFTLRVNLLDGQVGMVEEIFVLE